MSPSLDPTPWFYKKNIIDKMKKKFITVKNITAGDLPPAVRPFYEIASGVKRLRDAIVLTAIVCYCFLSPRLRVKYTYDNAMMLSMLLLNLLVIGPSGSGKSIIRWVVNMLVNVQILRDTEERRRLREYKELSKKEREKIQEPLVVIRFLQKFTLPVVVKYADVIHRRYKDWLSFFLYGDELSAFTENRRGNGDFQAVARTAYSLGETYSRDTLYQDGYNAMVDILWNSVICGQEQALAKYIGSDGIVLGDAGRQILVKLDDTLGEDAPVIRPLSEEQEREVKLTVNRLMAETFTDDDQLMPIHEVKMEWLDKDVHQWCAQTRDTILKTGSRAMDSFYVRASTSSFRICTMLYHLWGEESPLPPSSAKDGERTAEQKVRDLESVRKKVRSCYYYFAQLILDSAMEQWGQDYEAAMPKNKDSVGSKPTLFDTMPKRFSRDQLREMIIKEELNTPARIFIFKWMKKKWIYEVEKDIYEKLY